MGGAIGAAVASGAAGGSDVASAGPSPTTKSTVSGSDALVGGGAAGIIRNDRNNVRCSASETKIGQPSISRRCTRIAIRWLLLSIDRTGLGGLSPGIAPLFEIDDLSGATEPITIGHGGAFQSPQWQAAPVIVARPACSSYAHVGAWARNCTLPKALQNPRARHHPRYMMLNRGAFVKEKVRYFSLTLPPAAQSQLLAGDRGPVQPPDESFARSIRPKTPTAAEGTRRHQAALRSVHHMMRAKRHCLIRTPMLSRAGSQPLVAVHPHRHSLAAAWHRSNPTERCTTTRDWPPRPRLPRIVEGDTPNVMPALVVLVGANHVFRAPGEDVDGRDTPGHARP